MCADNAGSAQAQLVKLAEEQVESHPLEPVDPEVGELITSFEMAGVSLTICSLDDEMEQPWRAPADCPGCRKAGSQGPTPRYTPSSAPATVTNATGLDDTCLKTVQAAPASAASVAAGKATCQAVDSPAAALEASADELGRLDSVAGDGDHGMGVVRGARAAGSAARQELENGAGLRTVVPQAARAWAEEAGGTSGALWGAALTVMAEHFGDASSPSPTEPAASVSAATAAIADRGHAGAGDKTMLDALILFRDSFADDITAGQDLLAALKRAARASEAAARRRQSVATDRPCACARRAQSRYPDPWAVLLAVVARAILPLAMTD